MALLAEQVRHRHPLSLKLMAAVLLARCPILSSCLSAVTPVGARHHEGGDAVVAPALSILAKTVYQSA